MAGKKKVAEVAKKATASQRAGKPAGSVATEIRSAKHPGEVLLKEFMIPLGLSANRLALILHVLPQRIGEILNGRRGMTAETALRLARLFGTTASFWLDLQAQYELSQAEQKWLSTIEREIDPLGEKIMSGQTKSLAQIKSTVGASKASNAPTVGSKKKAQNSLPASVKLTERQKKIYKLIPADDLIYFDQLCAKTGLHAGELSAELTMLELDNLVERHPGDCYKRTAQDS